MGMFNLNNITKKGAWKMKKLDRTFGVEIEFGLNRDTYVNFKDEFEMRTGKK